uniref:Uncharacterized protein n=1 Tax=Tetraselmis sp. GSL018 TaxID=582737 RepID=A0A061RTR8_9CHLO
MLVIIHTQAQGLVRAMGGTEGIKAAVREKGVVLAAHGPFTAAGASAVLGVSVDCVSKDFSSFAGLVAALEDEFWAQ